MTKTQSGAVTKIRSGSAKIRAGSAAVSPVDSLECVIDFVTGSVTGSVIGSATGSATGFVTDFGVVIVVGVVTMTSAVNYGVEVVIASAVMTVVGSVVACLSEPVAVYSVECVVVMIDVLALEMEVAVEPGVGMAADLALKMRSSDLGNEAMI